MAAIKTIIFDIGAVLVGWNPAFLFRELIPDEKELDFFLTHVCTFDWNHSLDLGRSWEDARAEKVAQHPQYAPHIDAYWERWLEMFSGPIHESVA